MRESAADKGKRLLTEGRLVVEQAGPGYFCATVRGSADIHLVQYTRRGWSCSCPSRSTCGHLVAAALVSAPEALRRCAEPGCGFLVRGADRCPTHASSGGWARTARRTSTTEEPTR